jgi:hypothetical protein
MELLLLRAAQSGILLSYENRDDQGITRIDDTAIEAGLEYLIANGAGGIGPPFNLMFELAMGLERERCSGAGH